MSNHHIEKISINSYYQAEDLIRKIGCDPDSISIMAPKMIHHIIKLDHINLQDAIIIKQDMLSIGGEVCVPKHTFNLQGEPTSILICGTLTQFRILVEKLNRHYSRIQTIANEIDVFIQSIL